jgi:hypothetical protein
MKKTILLFLLTAYINASAATIYVNASATGSNNGLSWNNAYINLQEALSVAIPGDEIWVMAGTYKTTATTDRTISFVMKNGVNLYGGFNGTETSISQRNISANPTTLSGDIGALGEDSDNTYTLVRISNITSTLNIDGFRIISGKSTTGSGSGGLTLNNNTGIVNISNCFFFNNFGGTAGAVFVNNTGDYTVNILNSQFISNVSVDGVIHFANSSLNNLNIVDCEFKSTVTGGFAVLIFRGANLIMDRCIITNNTSNQSDLILIDANSSAKISNSLFIGNSYHESAIVFQSSSGISQILENVTITHNKKTFVPNNNTFYSTVYSVNGTAQIYNSIIYGNTNSSNNNQIDSGNTVSHSIVENGYTSGTNILNSDPLFINPNNLNAAPFDYSAFDYKLQNSSQGINYGDNGFTTTTLDLIENNRIQQSIVDVGAYENDSSLGIDDNTLSKKSLFYDYYNEKIVLKNIDYGKVVIYDTYGRLINSLKIRGEQSIDNLKTGIYFILLENTNERIKILKK